MCGSSTYASDAWNARIVATVVSLFAVPDIHPSAYTSAPGVPLSTPVSYSVPVIFIMGYLLWAARAFQTTGQAHTNAPEPSVRASVRALAPGALRREGATTGGLLQHFGRGGELPRLLEMPHQLAQRRPILACEQAALATSLLTTTLQA